MKQKPTSGRIVGMFGIPCSGKSTLIDMAVNASREMIARISSGDIARRLSQEAETKHMAEGNLFPHEDKLREEILTAIGKRRTSGAEVIILDGFPRTGEQVQWMLENQLVGTVYEGCLIKIHIDTNEAIRRACMRNRDDQDSPDLIIKKIDKQLKMIDELEGWIFRLGVPYYTIHNLSLQHSVENFVRRMELKK